MGAASGVVRRCGMDRRPGAGEEQAGEEEGECPAARYARAPHHAGPSRARQARSMTHSLTQRPGLVNDGGTAACTTSGPMHLRRANTGITLDHGMRLSMLSVATRHRCPGMHWIFTARLTAHVCGLSIIFAMYRPFDGSLPRALATPHLPRWPLVGNCHHRILMQSSVWSCSACVGAGTRCTATRPTTQRPRDRVVRRRPC
jgi:hypothetical protein